MTEPLNWDIKHNIIVAREIKFKDRAMYSILSKKPATLKIRYVEIEDIDRFEKEVTEEGALLVEHFYNNNSDINWGGLPATEYNDDMFNMTAAMLEKIRGKSVLTSEDGNTIYFPSIGIYSTSNPSVKIPKRVMEGEYVDWSYDYLIHTDMKINEEIAEMFGIEVPDILKDIPTRNTNRGRTFPRNLYQYIMRSYYYEKLKVRGILSVIRQYDGLVLADSEFWRIFQGSRLNDRDDEAHRRVNLKGDYEPISFPMLLRNIDITPEDLIELLRQDKMKVYDSIQEEFIEIFESFRIVSDMDPISALTLYEEYEMERIDLRLIINLLQDVFYDSMPSVLAYLPLYGINTEYMSVHVDNIKWRSRGDEYSVKFSSVKPSFRNKQLDFHN